MTVEFPFENARKISPELSCPIAPTLARPTVARFARRKMSEKRSKQGKYLTLEGEKGTICTDDDDDASGFFERDFRSGLLLEPHLSHWNTADVQFVEQTIICLDYRSNSPMLLGVWILRDHSGT